jgi:hypothetical protein
MRTRRRDRLLDDAPAGGVHGQVQRTEIFDGCVHGLLDTRFVGDITGMKRRAVSDLEGRLGAGRGREIEDGDLRPAFAQLLSGGACHARSASDDDDGLFPLDLHFTPLRLDQLCSAN